MKHLTPTTGFFVLLFMLNVSMTDKYTEANIKVILKSGDAKQFKSHKSLNLVVSYENLKIGEYNSEKEYLDKKVKENNEKEAGKGEKWLNKWDYAKTNVWPQRFEELYNKVLDKKLGMKCDRNSQSNPYTLRVKVTYIEPGYNVGVSRKPASANFEFELVNSTNNAEVIASLYLNHVPGEDAMGLDFDSDKRIGECFAKAGKMLAKYILKAK